MRHTGLILALLALPLAAACGKSGGNATAADVGPAFVAAVNAADAAAITAVYPSDELLKSSIECESSKLFERVAKSRAGMVKELNSDLKGLKLAWVGQEERDSKSLAAGEEIDGCKALVDVTMMRAKWKFTVTKEGETEEEGEGVELIKLGDAGWFLARM